MSKPTQITSMRIPTVDIVAAKTLKPKDSGVCFMLNLAGAFTVTLPPVAEAGNGWCAEFIVKTAPSGADYIVTEDTAADTDVLTGGVVERETDTGDDGPYSAAFTQVNLVDSVAVVGDRFTIRGDGSRFYVEGQVNADGAVTLT